MDNRFKFFLMYLKFQAEMNSSRNQKFRFLYFINIVLLNLIMYFPSFFHVPRSDQLLYLYYNAGKNHWIDLAIRSFDFNRTPTWQGGDIFFRPVLYFFMGTEKWLFGYNFILWQVTGFILHLITLCFLLKLLLKISRSSFAYLLTGFFSSILIIMEMVIFHHINSYLIFIICMLILLNYFYELICSQHISVKKSFTIVFVIIIACFSYELGFVYSFLFALYSYILLKNNRIRISYWRIFFLFILPIILYLIINFMNLHGRNYLFISDGGKIMTSFSLLKTVKNSLVSALWWLFAGFFPLTLKVFLYNRTQIFIDDPFFILEWPKLFGFKNFSIFMAIAGITAYCQIFLKTFNLKYLKRNIIFISFVFLVNVIFILLIVMGRTNVSGGLEKIQINTYYSYFFWLYFIVFIYSLIDIDRLREHKFYFRLKRISRTFILGLIVINCIQVLSMNLTRQKGYGDWNKLIKKINLLIKNDVEGDFSFKVLAHKKKNPLFHWVKTTDENREKKLTYFQLLYPQYYQEENPKYIFEFVDNNSDGIIRHKRSID